MQNSKENIRHCLLYVFQLGHNASEAKRNICHAIGNDAVSKATACRWFERFRNNNYSLNNKAKYGRPTEINLNKLKQVIESEPTLSTRAVASKIGYTQPAVLYHFKQFRLVSKVGEWVPFNLTQNQVKKPVKNAIAKKCN